MMLVQRCWPTIVAVLLAAVPAVATGTAAASTASGSPPTTSRYMVIGGDAQAGYQIGYRTGCTDGGTGVPGLRVLFFGMQEPEGRIRPPGTTAGSAPPTARIDEATVAATASGWIRGFTACGTSKAVLALGASNKSDGVVDGREAGQAWARLVDRVVAAAPADRVTVAGSLDGEPGWGKAQWARGWVDGYVATTSQALYTAGSADGCPETDDRETCDNGWSVADVFHLSTGAGPTVFALPQIYRTDGIQARQWAAISRWGVRNGRGPVRFAGALSQQAACRQKQSCTVKRIDNSPEAAREQLSNALAGDPGTRSAVPLIATDVAWPDGTLPSP